MKSSVEGSGRSAKPLSDFTTGNDARHVVKRDHGIGQASESVVPYFPHQSQVLEKQGLRCSFSKFTRRCFEGGNGAKPK